MKRDRGAGEREKIFFSWKKVFPFPRIITFFLLPVALFADFYHFAVDVFEEIQTETGCFFFAVIVEGFDSEKLRIFWFEFGRQYAESDWAWKYQRVQQFEYPSRLRYAFFSSRW